MAQSAHSEEVPARRVLLIRHGHYERTGELGDGVWGLSPLGRRQAARTGRRLARLVPTHPGPLAGIYTSPFPRAIQTAEIAAIEMDIETVRIKPYLHEAIALVPEGDPRFTASGLRPTSEADRERTVQQLERIRSRFLQPTTRHSTTLLFCHGNLIRYLVAGALGLPLESWMRMEVHHAGITEFRVYPGPMVALISYNDTGHMPPSMVTSH